MYGLMCKCVPPPSSTSSRYAASPLTPQRERSLVSTIPPPPDRMHTDRGYEIYTRLSLMSILVHILVQMLGFNFIVTINPQARLQKGKTSVGRSVDLGWRCQKRGLAGRLCSSF
ncbi:hypothetical protein BP00DRAFT_165200 [Aspergillus indologenus CBS 114.80]|uniref:Uncharacterized protein n=1 Tax=Aspergillus indologenus CBS 114.80 TaxID=1450541 RepID=A0A2V5ITR5_9EURO|nr:hypothetical protein BP00DRAFT_165200 [Aspergillus indologenus CBS 114.80]